MKIYKVGGCVRDAIMGRPCNDIDLAVEAESYEAMREGVLAMDGAKIHTENPEFFTIRAKTAKFGDTDFVLCRKDGEYKDGRRPENVEMGTITDDLERRDFTMNAISQNVQTGELYDPFGGQRDIKGKMIRCVGNPAERFREDALRVFRAIRFAVTLDFGIDKGLVYRIKGGGINYDGVATERITIELMKMFKASPKAGWVWLKELNLLDLVLERGIWFKPTVEKIK